MVEIVYDEILHVLLLFCVDIPSALHTHVARFEQNLIGHMEKEHMKDIISERQKEMAMLRHRWDRNKKLSETSEDDINQVPHAILL